MFRHGNHTESPRGTSMVCTPSNIYRFLHSLISPELQDRYDP